MSTPTPQDELTSTVFDAVGSLPQARKANFLLDTSLALIEAGQYDISCSEAVYPMFLSHVNFSPDMAPTSKTTWRSTYELQIYRQQM